MHLAALFRTRDTDAVRRTTIDGARVSIAATKAQAPGAPHGGQHRPRPRPGLPRPARPAREDAPPPPRRPTRPASSWPKPTSRPAD
ncbi:hypothetical protein NKH77_52870 [Streptomyces sp. M19]